MNAISKTPAPIRAQFDAQCATLAATLLHDYSWRADEEVIYNKISAVERERITSKIQGSPVTTARAILNNIRAAEEFNRDRVTSWVCEWLLYRGQQLLRETPEWLDTAFSTRL